MNIPIRKIRVPDELLSHDFGIQELAISIKKEGLNRPILVRPDGETYIVLSGSRRLRACILLGMETIDCTIHNDIS